MQISVLRRSGNPAHIPLLVKCAKFIGEKLFGGNISLTIVMSGKSYMEGMRGGTFVDTDSKQSNGFQIHLKGEHEIEEQILALCHELVHVKQILNGELRYIWDDNTGWHFIWRGDDMTDKNYRQRPWEIEAESQEANLANSLKGNIEIVNYAEENWSEYDTSEPSFLEADFDETI